MLSLRPSTKRLLNGPEQPIKNTGYFQQRLSDISMLHEDYEKDKEFKIFVFAGWFGEIGKDHFTIKKLTCSFCFGSQNPNDFFV